MHNSASLSLLPRPVQWLLVFYFLASLAHFAHNAEFIAFYPNFPSWITRQTVYLGWLAITAVGVAGVLALRLKLPIIGALSLAGYGAFGLDGLAHYTLALCSEHTLVTNITIWSEAISGLLLLLAGTVLAARQVQAKARANAA